MTLSSVMVCDSFGPLQTISTVVHIYCTGVLNVTPCSHSVYAIKITAKCRQFSPTGKKPCCVVSVVLNALEYLASTINKHWNKAARCCNQHHLCLRKTVRPPSSKHHLCAAHVEDCEGWWLFGSRAQWPWG